MKPLGTSVTMLKSEVTASGTLPLKSAVRMSLRITEGTNWPRSCMVMAASALSWSIGLPAFLGDGGFDCDDRDFDDSPAGFNWGYALWLSSTDSWGVFFGRPRPLFSGTAPISSGCLPLSIVFLLLICCSGLSAGPTGQKACFRRSWLPEVGPRGCRPCAGLSVLERSLIW